MAKLIAKGGGQRRYDIPNIAQDGVYKARCIDILETYNVEEEEYGKPGSMVTRDKMTILFAAKTMDGTESYLVQTKEFNISGSPKSNIVGFIKSWLGKPPPPAFDTYDLIGKTAQLSVVQKTSPRGTVYAEINSISVLMDESQAPAMDEMEIPGGARVQLATAGSEGTDATSGGGKDPF
jgi:hypothetical protein